MIQASEEKSAKKWMFSVPKQQDQLTSAFEAIRPLLKECPHLGGLFVASEFLSELLSRFYLTDLVSVHEQKTQLKDIK